MRRYKETRNKENNKEGKEEGEKKKMMVIRTTNQDEKGR
jgi:hypothetical protein